MNLEKLKDKLTAEEIADIEAAFSEAESKVAAARRESIDHRKTLKARVDAAEARVAALEDWAGIDAGADLAELPAPKGNADAVRQAEAKLKRAERERDDAVKMRDQALEARAADRRKAAVAQLAAKYEFIDIDDADKLIGSQIVAEGDDLLFRAPDGNLVPLDEGAAWLAKTKPHLIRPQGGTGSGYREGARPNGKSTMKVADFETLPPAERANRMAEGLNLID